MNDSLILTQTQTVTSTFTDLIAGFDSQQLFRAMLGPIQQQLNQQLSQQVNQSQLGDPSHQLGLSIQQQLSEQLNQAIRQQFTQGEQQQQQQLSNSEQRLPSSSSTALPNPPNSQDSNGAFHLVSFDIPRDLLGPFPVVHNNPLHGNNGSLNGVLAGFLNNSANASPANEHRQETVSFSSSPAGSRAVTPFRSR